MSGPLDIGSTMQSIVEYDKINNARGYRGWDANWRTSLQVGAFTGIQTFTSTVAATRGAAFAGRMGPQAAAFGGLFGGVAGNVGGTMAGEWLVDAIRQAGG